MKTFIIVLVVLVGAIIAGWYAIPEPEFTVQEQEELELPNVMQEREALTNGEYVLIPEESTMNWQGSRPLIEGYYDNGEISLSDGQATVAGGSVTAGDITIDMTSIRAESTGRGQGESMLTRHLKSEDWFNVEEYPESQFVFTSYEEHEDGSLTVAGELTIKDTTASLSFPAQVAMKDGQLVVEATDIEVDRTVWDIQYQSGSFFSDLGEKLIDDIFVLTFTAVFGAGGE